MLAYQELVNRELTQPTSPQAQIQTRQTLLTILHPLSQYPLFLNSVVDEYPDLKQIYLQKIKFPISLKEIKSKLQPRTLKYKFVGEVFRDLVLLLENCREFNAENDQLLLVAEQFEQAIQIQLNEFCKKLNAVSVDYKQLKDNIFKEFEPFPLPQQAKSPTEQDFQQFQTKFNALIPEQQGRLLAIIADELEEFEGGDFVLEFGEENGKIFWWICGQLDEIGKESDVLDGDLVDGEEGSEDEGSEVDGAERDGEDEVQMNEV
ncbi:Bromodomain-containing protein [Spironucleus salmonicida]|uniref:Bromodomain-containing protein n=1 Tax=Spironucleus salmonicida TaxID=348837 RepID=V6LYC0_9EUKA|nr:Bromodomain-containing protein [Spironucleus salmonicida]|eukprot:EST45799.1 Bromodomain-containing protein [Spironucleus salmonicida]